MSMPTTQTVRHCLSNIPKSSHAMAPLAGRCDGPAWVATSTAGRPAYENAYLFGAICPARGTAPRSRCCKRYRSHATPPPQRDIPPRRRGRARRSANGPCWMAHDGWPRHAEQVTPILLPSAPPKLNRSRTLAIHAGQLARQTACSRPTMPSSKRPARRGKSSLRNPTPSLHRMRIGTLGQS